MQRVQAGGLTVTAGGKVEPDAVAGANELGGHEQNLFAQSVERGILKLGWQAIGA